MPAKRCGQIREGGADVIACTRKDPAAVAVNHQLDPDAVPFPFGLVIGRGQPLEITRLVDRVGQHHRMESAAMLDFRARTGAVEPGEQLGVGNLQPVPDLFDLAKILPAIGGKRRFCQPCRYADTKPAGGKLDHRPALRRTRGIEEAGDVVGKLCLRQLLHRVNEGGDRGQRRGRGVRAGRPDQRDGFSHIANIVVGHQIQLGIDARRNQLAQRRRLQIGKAEVAGDRRQRDTAVGIGGSLEIAGHGRDLGIS